MVRKRSTATIGAVALGVVLAACGGGGGGGGGSGSSTSNPVTPPGPTAPTPSPADPAANYAGRGTQATIADANARALADSAWSGFELLYRLAGDVVDEPLSPGAVNQTVTGTTGSATLRGTIAADGTGTLTIDYASYGDGDATLNGRETQQILETRIATRGAVRRTFEGLTLRADGIEVRLAGSLTRRDSPSTTGAPLADWQVTGDLLATETATGEQVRIASATFAAPASGSPAQLLRRVTGTARVFDSTHGYLDVTVEPAVSFLLIDGAGPDRFAPGGSLAARGAASTALWVSPLSADHVALELDTEGRGRPARALSFRWSDAFDRGAGSDGGSPTAITGPDLVGVVTGQPFLPEGRWSEHGANRFLKHSWRLALQPPGSTAQLADADSSRPRVTPDLPGTYLLELTVADGSTVSRDWLSIRAIDPGTTLPRQPSVVAHVKPTVLVAEPNTEITLDGTRSYALNGAPLRTIYWTVYRTDEPPAVFSAATARVPASPWISDVQLVVERQFSLDTGSASKRVAVRPNPAFLPVHELDRGNSENGIAAGVDLDGDGDVDLMRQMTGRTFALSVWLNEGGAKFGTPFTSSPNDGFRDVIDVDGDRLLDLVTTAPGGVAVARQTAPGRFANPVVFTSATCRQYDVERPPWVEVADVDRDGDRDLLAPTGCDPASVVRGRQIEVFRADSTQPGGFRRGELLPVPGLPVVAGFIAESLDGIARDFDGDGTVDLALVLFGDSASAREYVVLRGTGPDRFEVASRVANAVPSPPLVGDLDGDGRVDLVPAGTGTFAVALQRAGGVWEGQVPTFDDVLERRDSRPFFELRDVDADGRLDLIAAAGWYRNAGGLRFERYRAFTAPGNVKALADLDGDGRLDLVWAEDGRGDAEKMLMGFALQAPR